MKSTEPKLQQSNNYSLFIHHDDQQPMSQHHVQSLAASMRKSGYLPSKPIQVYRRKDGKYVIIDGHHRIAAARLAGICFFFVVEPEENSALIGDVNAKLRKWVNASFASLHANHGNKNYATLLYYVNKGLPLKQAASLLRGESAHSGNAGIAIKEGKFVVKTTKSADTILSFIERVGEIAPNIKKCSYIEAVSILLFVPEFEIETLAKRIEANPHGIVPCANRIQALESLEEVYNFRAREKFPLSFMAAEKMKERQAVSCNGR